LVGSLVDIVVAGVLPLGMSSPYYESAVGKSSPSLVAVGSLAGAVFFGLFLVASRLLCVKNGL
jgi:hypothetical protein